MSDKNSSRILVILVSLLALSEVCIAQGGSRDGGNRNGGNRGGGIGDSAPFAAATTVQQPSFGVAIDPSGVLKSVQFADPADPLLRQRVAAAKAKLPGDLFAPSNMRKVSLKKLSKAIEGRIAGGDEPTEAMRKFAGLLRIQYVFVLPEEDDIVLAGPAEGWLKDPSGRVVGATSRWPTILLDDLVVALNAFHQRNSGVAWVGCSIEPTKDAMSKLVAFNRSIPPAVPQARKLDVATHVVSETRNALGLANILVFNISPRSHMAQVMIEADYRMKLTALGLSPPPMPLVTFFQRLNVHPRSQMQRWWFQASPSSVKMSADRLNMEIMGRDVILSTEDFAINKDGSVRNTGRKPSGPAKAYAKNFSKFYRQISRASPVFGQLRNMVDLLVVSAFLKQEKAFDKAGLESRVLIEETNLLAPPQTEPKKVPCVVNAKWSANRLIAASGGVSIDVQQVLSRENLIDADYQLPKELSAIGNPADHWWWD